MKFLGKTGTLIILFVALLIAIKPTNHAQNSNVINIHFFHSTTCPHCIAETEFLNKITEKYPLVRIHKYDIADKTNVKLLIESSKQLKTNVAGVPFTVIGDEFIVGFQSEDTTGVEIENIIQASIINNPKDIVSDLVSANMVKDESGRTRQTTDSVQGLGFIKVPFLGNVEIAKLSLPALTILIGVLDGFNPCAMWVLLFLISLLIGVRDRKRMWVLGGTFLLVSGIIYYLFMAAWLNVFLIIGYATIVRYIIAAAAAGIGVYYLRRYVKNKDGGCETADYSKKQQIFAKIKNIVATHNLAVACGGVATLAIAVNMFELLCSAGLPAIYTKVLVMTPMPKAEYYLYLLVYVLFFMLDDIVVFLIAMITLKTIGIENKYARYSQLIGGLIMLALGILMAVNPALLTFASN